jgi:eukaryotic-like serine/threonine-protein kinase
LDSESSKEISNSTRKRYRFGAFALDPSERLLLHDETPIPLTPKAFDLLVLLVESAGRLLEKDALMRRLWSDTFVEEANLSNNVSLLRKALGESEQGTKYIETVPKRGYRFVADVIELVEPSEASTINRAPTSGRQTIVRLAAAAVSLGVIAIAVALWLSAGRPLSAAAVTRFSVTPPPGTSLPPAAQPVGPAISPDGTRLVFHVIRGGVQFLAVRAFDAVQAQLLPGTEGGRFPFWKPDGREIAFFAGGKLKAIALSGGAVRTICDAGLGFGGTWNRADVIVFAPADHDALFQVVAAGGTPSALTSLQKGERYHRSPSFLADGNRFVFFANPDALYLGSLDRRAPERVLTTDRMGLMSERRYLLFAQGSTLSAQRFDERRLALVGNAVPIAEDLVLGGLGAAGFSVSEAAVAYVVNPQVSFSLTWVNRAGQRLGSVGPFHFGPYGDVDLSPDGKQISIVNAGNRFQNANVWVYESTGMQPTQLTFTAPNRFPIWSFDSRALAFVSGRVGASGLYQRRVDGGSPEEMLMGSDSVQPEALPRPSDWSRDGIVYEVTAPETRRSTLWMLPTHGDRKPYRLVLDDSSQHDGKISPDGRWLAYSSDQSGRPEVFVQSVSTPELKWNISTTGGSVPRWRRDGKELFYLGLDGTLISVPVSADATAIHAGVAQPLFQTGLNMRSDLLRTFAVAPDGQQLLISIAENPDLGRAIVVVLNWQALLKR